MLMSVPAPLAFWSFSRLPHSELRSRLRSEKSDICVMKIDCLKTGSDDCPLVRIYDFDSDDAKRLRQAFESLADGSVERVQLEHVESVDGTQITFTRGKQDRGVAETSPHHFEIMLAPEGWQQAADCTEPFCEGKFGYQWLIPQTRGIQLLLSKDGAW